jgi:hypothetical protein
MRARALCVRYKLLNVNLPICVICGERMTETMKVLKVENPHFTIMLSEDLLKIDLKGSLKNELGEAIENEPVLKNTVGKILGMFVPLHIPVSEIDSVNMDETGKVTVSLLHHRNIVIPFEHKENAEKFLKKIKELILNEKMAKLKEHAEMRHAERKLKKKHADAKRKSTEKKYAERAHEVFDS